MVLLTESILASLCCSPSGRVCIPRTWPCRPTTAGSGRLGTASKSVIAWTRPYAKYIYGVMTALGSPGCLTVVQDPRTALDTGLVPPVGADGLRRRIQVHHRLVPGGRVSRP